MAPSHGAALALLGVLVAWFYLRACARKKLYGASKPSKSPKADFARPVMMGGVPGRPLDPFVVNRSEPKSECESEAERVANTVARLRIASVEAEAPKVREHCDLAPQGLAKSAWQGVQPFFTKERCFYHRPMPRAWATSLSELYERRARVSSVENVPEPLCARQRFAQLLAADWSSKRDNYTRPALGNLIGGACVEMAHRTPTSVAT